MTGNATVFALPPGAAFPRAFVSGFVTRYGDLAAEKQAAVEIFVNSARMLRAIRTAFDECGPRLLPRLRLISDLGFEPGRNLPPPVPKLRRKLLLGRLIAARMDREGFDQAGTAAFDLADSLAGLLAEMQDEGIATHALEDPDIARDHAEHWNRSLGFLRIIAEYLDKTAEPDPESRQRRIVESLASRWAAQPPGHPVLVVGSTGSRGTTQLLMQAVAALPQGALVLPGFDFEMPEPVWNSLCSGPKQEEDHPQYRLARLTTLLKLAHGDVKRWVDDPDPVAARNKVVSLALRPAPMTDQWITEGRTIGDLGAAMQDIALVEAPTQRSEALAIAVALREAVANGQRAALITPDRGLTRRVAAALDRWGILPDDSGGEPLSQTPPGRLLLQVAALFCAPVTVGPLLGILKHPLVATGGQKAMRGRHLLHARDLELELRRNGPAYPAGKDLLEWGRKSGDGARAGWAEWLAEVLAAMDGGRERPLAEWVALLRLVAESLAAGAGSDQSGELWERSAGRSLKARIETLSREAEYGGTLSSHVFQQLLRNVLSEDSRRETDEPHPLVSIWGTLEARVQGADLVILGSLNEGSWPEPPTPDPWMSRQMRQRIGLLSPERKIGLSAHDFQQSIAATRVILSRSRRDADTEAVPSRWLARLTNLLTGLPMAGGPSALAAMRDRGRRLVDLASVLDRPEQMTAPQRRPAPRPPVADRPKRLSVTQIESLIADPYAIYARHVLRLRPLEPLVAEADPRLRGDVLHKLVEGFVRQQPENETPEQAHARLLAGIDTILDAEVPWPIARRLWRARIVRIADTFLADERKRIGRGTPAVIEEQGMIALNGADFTLSAKPDRIDRLRDGTLEVFDYKSGKPPGPADMKRYRVQLLVEACMAERGAFAGLDPASVSRVTYIQIGGEGETRSVDIEPGQTEATWEGLETLIGSYQNPATAYVAHALNIETDYAGDYDGVSRFGEWALHDHPVPEDLE